MYLAKYEDKWELWWDLGEDEDGIKQYTVPTCCVFYEGTGGELDMFPIFDDPTELIKL